MTRDCRSIGTNNGEVSGLREKAKFKMRQEFNSRLTYSLFCVHLSNQKFGDSVGDARTTKLPRRESAAPAARITDKSVSAQCAPSARQRKGPEMPGQPSLPPRAKSKLANILRRGGGSGIRTHVTVSRKHAFQACAFSHSATPPIVNCWRQTLQRKAPQAAETITTGRHETTRCQTPYIWEIPMSS
jgi:hypothetical protein